MATRVAPQGRLVIWLTGPSGPLFERVNSYGLHILRVHYANGWFGQFGNAAPPGDDQFLGKIRLEAATGEDLSQMVKARWHEGARLAVCEMAGEGESSRPLEYFLTDDRQRLRWDRVIISGSSHGATVSAPFAQHQRVDHVVMCCGPRDQFKRWQALPSVTPADCFFGFSHVLDDAWKGDHYCRSWELLDLQQFGWLVNVEQSVPP